MKIENLNNYNFLIKPNKIGEKTGSVNLIPSSDNKKTDLIDELSQWEENEKDGTKSPKWDLERIPLKFFINPLPTDENYLKEFEKAVETAFSPWERASAGIIRFEKIYNLTNADIIIEWSNTATLGREYEAGHSNLKIAGNKIDKAEITVLIYPIIDAMAAPEARIERVRRTAVHEIGHVLGLNHSNSSKDVMHHRGINNKNLSENDIRRLNELYSSKSKEIIL